MMGCCASWKSLLMLGAVGAVLVLGNSPAQSVSTNFPNNLRQNYDAAVVAAERKKNYDAAMKLGQAASDKGDYAGALEQAKVALVNKPNDGDAQKLESDAQVKIKQLSDPQKNERQFQFAFKAAKEAFARNDFGSALKCLEQALDIKPIDASAILLREDVREKLLADNTAREQQEQQERSFQAAMRKVREAFDSRDYTNAVAWAEAALKVRPSDPDAMKLKDRASGKVATTKKISADSVAILDEELEVMMVELHLLRPREAHAQKARETPVFMGLEMSPETKQIFRQRAEDLTRQYESRGLLDAKRKDSLQRLQKMIVNF